MKCLCCGKEIENTSESLWHESCIRKFFNKTQLPEIELDKKLLEDIIFNNVTNKSLIPGVQKKLSLGLSAKSKRGRLTLVDFPLGYILKPQVKEFPYLPELEHLTMLMAEASKISVVPHALIKCEDELAYITKRVDREIGFNSCKLFAMEDFCQLSRKLTFQKYNGSYEQCVKIIDRYSSQPGADKAKLFILLLFCFITGNSDMHLKNFSLISNTENSEIYQLAPAYDLLSTNLIMSQDKEEFALTMNGKKQNLTRNDFIYFGTKVCGLSKKATTLFISDLINMHSKYNELIDESFISEDMKLGYKDLISSRIKRLEK